MIRKNCGIFDELTRKCLACGELQEGAQCANVFWSRMELYQAAASLLGIPTVLSDYDSKLLLSTDNSVWRAHGTQFDPLRFVGQQLWFIERLITVHGFTIDFNPSLAKFRFTGAAPERYKLLTQHNSFGAGLMLAAAKMYLVEQGLQFPVNVAEDSFP